MMTLGVWRYTTINCVRIWHFYTRFGAAEHVARAIDCVRGAPLAMAVALPAAIGFAPPFYVPADTTYGSPFAGYGDQGIAGGYFNGGGFGDVGGVGGFSGGGGAGLGSVGGGGLYSPAPPLTPGPGSMPGPLPTPPLIPPTPPIPPVGGGPGPLSGGPAVPPIGTPGGGSMPTPVPEPTSWLILAAGAAGLLAVRILADRRKQEKHDRADKN